MAVDIKFSTDGTGVEYIATGIVNGSDIIAANKRVWDPAKIPHYKYHLIDRSGCEEYYVSAGEIELLAQMDCAAAEINPHIIMAIVSPNELLESLADVWKERVTDCFRAETFHTRDEAMNWIRQQLNKNGQSPV